MNSATGFLSKLDPDQRAVATCLTGPVCVIAGAGTGKTRAITHRIAYACSSGRYDPHATLAVTFTTRAAGEMKARLQQLQVPGVQARTFHGAALKQAQFFWPRAYGSGLPPVEENRFRLVAEAARRQHLSTDTTVLRDLIAEISWAKVSNVTMDEYPVAAAQAGREVAAADHATIGRIFSSYEAAKCERGVIDFDDILLCAAALLQENADVAAEVRRRYRHFVVDEYQDVNPLQETLLNLWRAGRPDFCVVGDPAQTIHSFAGAQAKFLLDFPKKNPDCTVIKLVRDYRSTPQIVSAANKISGPHSVSLQAQLPSGPEPIFVASDNETEEATAVAHWITDLAKQGIEYRNIAVLYRINAQSVAIESALTEQGIPYVVRGAERFYDRKEVRQALTMMRASRSTDHLHAGLTQIRNLFSDLGWKESAPNGLGAERERWESLSALLSVAEDFNKATVEKRQRAATFAEIVEELDQRAKNQHAPTAQGVTVTTMHSAKGLEWQAVALYGVHEGILPFVLATTEEQIQEERRLLYVGVTRAQTQLRISWSRSRSSDTGNRQPSRFLAPFLSVHNRGFTSVSRTRRATGSQQSAKCRVCEASLRTPAERKLGRHLECEVTYDEHTLQLLKQWRKQQADIQKIPAYCVFTDATLLAIAEAQPGTDQELLRIPGVGKLKISKYGQEVLSLLDQER